MDRPNLTVLTQALVTRVIFQGKRAIGVEIARHGMSYRIDAGQEIVLSLGAINTPKVLMQSGIGNANILRHFGIAVLQHLPGVGQNFQDHVAVGCLWEYPQPLPARNNGSEVTFFWKSDPGLDAPDLQTCQTEMPLASPETAARFNPPSGSWTMYAGVVQPKSRGQIRLTGPAPRDPVQIDAATLSHPDDMKAAIAGVKLCRPIANAAALRPFVRREVMPGDMAASELEDFVRAGASTFFHPTCTAKMGRDAMSVVDGDLRVYGTERLRIADASIMPRVTTGNTMAPCVVIGERAGEVLKAAYRL